MGFVEMIRKKYYFHFMDAAARHLHDKYGKVQNFVQKTPPEYLSVGYLNSQNETGSQKLEQIILQLIGEEGWKKLTPYDWFCISAISCIYPIGVFQEYKNNIEFYESLKTYQVKAREFLEKNYLEMGLEEIDTNIFKMAGFSGVISKQERDSIINEIISSPDASIRAANILLLEALFKLAALLVMDVPCHQTGSSMIEGIKIDHSNQKITIEATYLDPYEKKWLDKFINHIDEELKVLQKVFEDNSIFLNTITLEARVKELATMGIKEENFFGREREIRKIFLLSEARGIAIVTGCSGVGITTTLKYGIEPALRNVGAHVIYCSIDKGFQQFILKILDQQFPNYRSENLFTQLKMLSSKNHLLVFILDDFEKIFTIDDSKKLTIEMFNFLKEFEEIGSSNNRLIIGIKEDFLGDMYHFSKGIPKFYKEEAFYHLKNLDRLCAREVMVKTIEKMNFPVDEQLIETILDDLTQRDDSIYPPLIYIIFNQLFKKLRGKYPYGSEKNPFNINFYNSIEGADSILLEYAREKMEEFSEEEQEVGIGIFQKMVTPFFTRQRTRHQEILELNDHQINIEQLLHRLLELRLIKRIQTASGYEYELIHDSLKGLFPVISVVTNVEDTSSFVREALAYIDANYDKQISLQEVAKKVGVTPEYLSRQFKSGFKIGFKEYVTQKRIEEAKQLLLRFPELPINELSQKTGFMSPQHFINVFKNETQYTPLKFRQRSLPHSDSVDDSDMRNH